MNVLDWIGVGEVSAERDENLVHYFFDAGVSQKILSNKKQFLLLGRKGAGKSALFEFLKAKPESLFDNKSLVIPLSLASYNWNAHFLLADPQKGVSAAQRDSWRFVVAIETIRALFTELRDDAPHSLREANDVLERVFSKPIPKWTDLLGEKLFGLSKVKLPGGSFDPIKTAGSLELGEVSFSELQKNNDLKTQLSRNISSFTEYLERKLKESLGGRSIYLIFDRLDEAWLESHVNECKQVITGLINASEYVLGCYDARIRPIVFLREDIFFTLDLNDKNKLKEDCGSALVWDSETLLQMLTKRLQFFAEKKKVSLQTIESLFDKKTMRSRATPPSYILNRTFYRPRDLVAYYRKVIEHAKNHSVAGTLPVESIYEAEASYSEYIYQELIDEWKTQSPEISNYLDLLENIGTSTISTDVLAKAFSEKLSISDRAKFRTVLRFLFENSIIGFRVGQSNQWRFKCAWPHQGFQDTELYRVHPGLKKRLGIRDTTSSVVEDDE
jgi:hypothetical protein